jgi:5-methylcytosine-specific restriction enzyme subunit McrC
MKAMGVSGAPPTKGQMTTDRFGRHDADDRSMVAAARLAFDLALPMEVSGANLLPLPDREERWVRRLFERAVGGFFSAVLPPGEWCVTTGSSLAWQIEWSTPRIDRILPKMRTDIVLDHRLSGRKILIDTKFTSILTSSQYRDEILRSGYLYQIYAYLRSQVGRGDISADRAEGVLLHPSVGENVSETVFIQGHCIRFMTIDLTATPSAIRAELLGVASPAPTLMPTTEVHHDQWSCVP